MNQTADFSSLMLVIFHVCIRLVDKLLLCIKITLYLHRCSSCQWSFEQIPKYLHIVLKPGNIMTNFIIMCMYQHLVGKLLIRIQSSLLKPSMYCVCVYLHCEWRLCLEKNRCLLYTWYWLEKSYQLQFQEHYITTTLTQHTHTCMLYSVLEPELQLVSVLC